MHQRAFVEDLIAYLEPAIEKKLLCFKPAQSGLVGCEVRVMGVATGVLPAKPEDSDLVP